MTTPQLSKQDFMTDQDVRWCPGCGDYAILSAVQKTLPELGIARENVVFVSGIGCSSRFPYYMNTYGFHSIHGRAPAIATGLKVARPDLSVWVITGDGDGLSIGGNHLLHALRRNVDVNILLFNNQIYGLTKGQYSPTSAQGTRSPSTPLGSVDYPVNPIAVALGASATFVARCIDVEAAPLGEVLTRAYAHKGTSFVEILQNCPVFNDEVWEPVANKRTRIDRQLSLEHGKPLVFANGQKGIRIKSNLEPEVVDVGDEPGQVPLADIPVHDERAPIPYAVLLAHMSYPEFPIPLGILRAVERPSYDDLAVAQVNEAIRKRGKGEIESLLRSGMTWEIGEDGRPK